MRKILSKLRFAGVEIIKGVAPGGSVAVKVVEHFVGKDLATGEKIDAPTNWGAVIVRIVGLVILLILVVKDVIPVEDLVKILKGLI